MTLWAIAIAMERNPSFAKACVRDGHEIGAHGYRWLDIWDYSLEEDKTYIKKTCKVLEAATGASFSDVSVEVELIRVQESFRLEHILEEVLRIQLACSLSCGKRWAIKCYTLLKCITKIPLIGSISHGRKHSQTKRRKAC